MADILKTRDLLTWPRIRLLCIKHPKQFNTTFQAMLPLVQELKRKYEKIIREFASNFMHIDYVRETSCNSLNPLNKDNLWKSLSR